MLSGLRAFYPIYIALGTVPPRPAAVQQLHIGAWVLALGATAVCIRLRFEVLVLVVTRVLL